MFLLVCTFSYKFEIVMYVSLVVIDVIVRLLLSRAIFLLNIMISFVHYCEREKTTTTKNASILTVLNPKPSMT